MTNNNFMFNVSRGFNVEEIAAALPLHLQQEVFLHLHEHLVRQVPMFEGCDDGFIKALVQLLLPQVLLQGDYAFKVLELGQTMYFIQNGSIQIVSDSTPQASRPGHMPTTGLGPTRDACPCTGAVRPHPAHPWASAMLSQLRHQKPHVHRSSIARWSKALTLASLRCSPRNGGQQAHARTPIAFSST